jgi:hypothetical protein
MACLELAPLAAPLALRLQLRACFCHVPAVQLFVLFSLASFHCSIPELLFQILSFTQQ